MSSAASRGGISYKEFIPSPDAKCNEDARLCSPCRNLIIEVLDDVKKNATEAQRHHHVTKQALAVSAERCRMCRLILQELDYRHGEVVDG